MTTTTYRIGGELTVRRLGFGAMRLPGAHDPATPAGAAREMLHEALRLGVNLIDTAHAYGRSEELIAQALHPYPDGLVIGTKGGLREGGHPDGRPERLRADCEASLRRLRLDTIDVWQLHRIDPDVPLEDQFGTIRELRDEGKIRFVGVSEVTPDELRRGRELIEIATVQNRYSIGEQGADAVLRACETDGIAFLPWAPVRMGDLAAATAELSGVAARHDATAAQVALAWLLQRSPAILPIPGTSSVDHLRENVAATGVDLTDDDLEELSRVGSRASS
jgi:aryl-alcohol dehydrogenase-like predicted oxidoreductase